jgi:hypothetical protein
MGNERRCSGSVKGGWLRSAYRIVLLAIAALALFASGCDQTKFNKVSDAEVDQAQKAVAVKFGTDTLTAWAKDTYPKVGIPADPKFKEGQEDEAKAKAADKAIEADAGDFVSMTFHEAQKSEPAKFILYRFKAKFTKKEPVEVRVVFDTDAKISGFWIKPWKDSL